MPDEVLRAAAPESGFALFAATTTGLVREVAQRHDLSPTVAAALGRLTTGAVLLASNLGQSERISLQISADGPIGALTAEAWPLPGGAIGARGYARHRHADLPIDARGKFNVGRAVGSGMLQVTRSSQTGQPYVGVVPLESGEIAEDIAAYLARSEQIPSVVALGVLANPDGIVAAGGAIAQMLPGSSQAQLESLERRALAMPPITAAIASGADAKGLLAALAGETQTPALRAQDRREVRFVCRCSREKVETALLGLGRDELANLRDRSEPTEAVCEFCRNVYRLDSQELGSLIERLDEAKTGSFAG